MRIRLLSVLFLTSLFAFANPCLAELPAPIESENGDYELTLREVSRRNDVLTVKAKLKKLDNEYSHQLRFWISDNTFLLDEEKGVKYFVLEDKERNKLASPGKNIRSSGDTVSFWVKFPAPPLEKKSISIYFSGYEPLDDVAIEDK